MNTNVSNRPPRSRNGAAFSLNLSLLVRVFTQNARNIKGFVRRLVSNETRTDLQHEALLVRLEAPHLVLQGRVVLPGGARRRAAPNAAHRARLQNTPCGIIRKGKTRL